MKSDLGKCCVYYGLEDTEPTVGQLAATAQRHLPPPQPACFARCSARSARFARIASIASIAGFGHAPPDWPRFHDTAHRGCSLTHALHPAHCTPAPHTRHTATRHPERKPPAASHTDRTRSRLSALHAAPHHASSGTVCNVTRALTSRTARWPAPRSILEPPRFALRVGRRCCSPFGRC